jgi:cell division protein FtsB
VSDPVEANEQFERKILAIPEDGFLSLQRRVKGLIALVISGMIAGLISVLIVTGATNRAVTDEVVPILEEEVDVLQAKNADLEAENAELEDVTNQATDAIVLLIKTLQDNGITPPEIVIRPTTTTTTPEEPDG